MVSFMMRGLTGANITVICISKTLLFVHFEFSIRSRTIDLDYSSLVGGEPVNLAVDMLIDNWKGFLPRFKSTHYHPQPDRRNIWTVFGTYDAGLEKYSGEWKVTALKLNLSCVDGNLELPALVMQLKRQHH
jgi:hypothetical protein